MPMGEQHLLDLPPQRRAIELRRVQEREAASADFDRARRRMMWQCAALSLIGVPIYATSWGVADERLARVWISLGFFVSYAAPFFRWLRYHVKTSEEFR